MKTLLLLLSFLTLSTSIAADHVSEERASLIAQKILGNNAESSCKVKRFELPGTAEQAPQKEPPYYIFESNQGFAIIAADDCVPPVQAYSQDHTIGDDIPCGMKMWLDATEQYINDTKASGQEPSPAVKDQWIVGDDYIGRQVIKLTTADWNQRYPYNMYCPTIDGSNCLTGCTATAYAIVMYYHNWPEHGFGWTTPYTSNQGATVLSRNLGHTYDWNKMTTSDITAKDPIETQQAVATLMADIGAAIKSDYGIHGTGAALSNGVMQRRFNYLGSYGYQVKTDYSTWVSELTMQLNYLKPVLYASGGHCFVLDGYTDQNYFHVNWGWGGYSNGYFQITNLLGYSTGRASCVLDFEPDYTFDDKDYWTVYCDLDGRGYTSLNRAIDIAPDNEPYTIKLLKSQEAEPFSGYYLDVTIDLNGKDLTFTDHSFICPWDGTITITDNSDKKTGTITDGRFYSPDNSLLYVTGGKYRNCTFEVAGGCLITGARIENDRFTPVYMNPGSEVEVESSTLICKNYSYTIANNGGNLTITNTNIENYDETCAALFCMDQHETYLENVMIKSPYWPIYMQPQSNPIACFYGMFSSRPEADYLSPECIICENTDPLTKGFYPYIVCVDAPDGLPQAPWTPTAKPKEYISLTGQKSTTPHPGINIINGQKVKISK